MRKLITFITFAFIFIFGVACGVSGTNVEANTTDSALIQGSDGEVINIRGDIRFVPVEKERITLHREDSMYTLVDLQTGCMYLYAKTYTTSIKSADGVSISIIQLTNADGMPCIYEDLDELREFYKYNAE